MQNVEVGTFNKGTLSISGGATLSSGEEYVDDGYAYLGDATGSTGVATVSGSGSQWNNSFSLVVGNSGSGTLNVQSSGNVTSGRQVVVGANSGSTGTVNVGDGPALGTYAAYIGYGGKGTLNVQSGGYAQFSNLRSGARTVARPAQSR